MFDIAVVGVLLGLTLLALTRFPAEGGRRGFPFASQKPRSSSVCAMCRAAVGPQDVTCLTCGRSVGHEIQRESVIR